MALFKPYKILKTQLANLPEKEGQLIFVTDTGEMYLDVRDNERILIKNSKSHNTWVGTKSEYDAIGTKDNQTLYFIKQG